jgi:hypothetical protein
LMSNDVRGRAAKRVDTVSVKVRRMNGALSRRIGVGVVSARSNVWRTSRCNNDLNLSHGHL